MKYMYVATLSLFGEKAWVTQRHVVELFNDKIVLSYCSSKKNHFKMLLEISHTLYHVC